MRLLVSLASCAVLAGCALPRPEPLLPPSQTSPDSFAEAAPLASADDDARDAVDLASWWTAFHDPVLDRVIGESIANNRDLKIAAQRLTLAKLELKSVEAGASPTVGVSGTSTVQRTSKRLDWPHGIGVTDTKNLQFEASWEPDLFGRVAHAIEASEAELHIAQEDRRGILVSLLATIANRYIDLRLAQMRLALAQDAVERQEQVLETIEKMHRAGLAKTASVLSARTELHAALSDLASLRLAIAQHTHAISTAAGGFPQDLDALLRTSPAALPLPPRMPQALPSEMLRARPDIRAAERRIAAATARTNVAIADLFPRFRIPLTLGTSSSGWGPLFSGASAIWSLGVTGSLTVFDGGRRKDRIEMAKAITDMQRLDYERTVRGAFLDVEDALAALREEDLRARDLVSALDVQHEVLARAVRERTAGINTRLDLLAAQRAEIALQDRVATSHAAQLHVIVALSKALGGGWQSTFAEESSGQPPPQMQDVTTALPKP